MRAYDGLWWPDMDVRGRPAIVAGAVEAIPLVLSLLPRRGVCVQAGGNVGVYPVELAKHFGRVITFEPDADNFACLVENVKAENVTMHNAALGEVQGRCAVRVFERDNCGAHMMTDGDAVDVLTIDGLGLSECDLIWLDVEGQEAAALRGAAQTIERFRPLIVCEEKGLGEPVSLSGYNLIDRIGNDNIYRPS